MEGRGRGNKSNPGRLKPLSVGESPETKPNVVAYERVNDPRSIPTAILLQSSYLPPHKGIVMKTLVFSLILAAFGVNLFLEMTPAQRIYPEFGYEINGQQFELERCKKKFCILYSEDGVLKYIGKRKMKRLSKVITRGNPAVFKAAAPQRATAVLIICSGIFLFLWMCLVITFDIRMK